jgi:hypothetical protein
MHRLLLCSLLFAAGIASAADLSDFTKADATTALRSALTQGAVKAVGQLGQADGFLLNPEVKIPLPPQLQKGERLMRRFAVPEAKTLLVGAVKSMSVADAKSILTGGNDSATQYFRTKTQAALAIKFKPIVAQATGKAGVAQSYNSLAGKVAQYGLIDAQSANLDDYVTAQALDGLYKMIAKEELAIRNDPLGQSSKLLQRVFGAMAGQ